MVHLEGRYLVIWDVDTECARYIQGTSKAFHLDRMISRSAGMN